jgi:membrane-bound lytic murein transglycosylase D
VVVPTEKFSYSDRRRVFYRVVPGDTLATVARLFAATADDLCRWNAIDPTAHLQDGMTLQVYVTKIPARANPFVLQEKDAHVLEVGSPEFFAHFEAQRGRTRLEIVVRKGDTWRSIARRYDLTVAQLERINGRARTTLLSAGDKLVVYVATSKLERTPPATESASGADGSLAAKDVAVARPATADASLAGDAVGRALMFGARGATPERAFGATLPAAAGRPPSPSNTN